MSAICLGKLWKTGIIGFNRAKVTLQGLYDKPTAPNSAVYLRCEVKSNMFFFNLASLLRFGKTGNKKSATYLATLLQNELYGDVAQFTTNIKPVLQQIRLLTGFNEVVKRATSLFNSLQCCKTSCTFFVARFSVPLDRGMQPINYNVPPRPIVSYNWPL